MGIESFETPEGESSEKSENGIEDKSDLQRTLQRLLAQKINANKDYVNHDEVGEYEFDEREVDLDDVESIRKHLEKLEKHIDKLEKESAKDSKEANAGDSNLSKREIEEELMRLNVISDYSEEVAKQIEYEGEASIEDDADYKKALGQTDAVEDSAMKDENKKDDRMQ